MHINLIANKFYQCYIIRTDISNNIDTDIILVGLTLFDITLEFCSLILLFYYSKNYCTKLAHLTHTHAHAHAHTHTHTTQVFTHIYTNTHIHAHMHKHTHRYICTVCNKTTAKRLIVCHHPPALHFYHLACTPIILITTCDFRNASLIDTSYRKATAMYFHGKL